jgi:uncharacterized protein YkwD
MRLAPLARMAILFVLCAVMLAFARPARTANPTQPERALLTALNDVRAGFHLQRLRFSKRLQEGAQGYARRLRYRNLFAHAHLPADVAETLAWGRRPAMEPREIVRLWLESPTHRVVLLWPEARRVGFGISIGTYRGYESISVAVGRFSQ